MQMSDSDNFVRKLKGNNFSKPIIDFFKESSPASPTRGTFKLPKAPRKNDITFKSTVHSTIAPVQGQVVQTTLRAAAPFPRGRFTPAVPPHVVAPPQAATVPLGSSWHHHHSSSSTTECDDTSGCDDAPDCGTDSKCDDAPAKCSTPAAPHFDSRWGVHNTGSITTDPAHVVNPSNNGDSGALFNLIKSPVLVQSDGRVVVGGSTQIGNVGSAHTRNVVVVRYLSNGSALDASFGVGGVFTYAFPGSGTTPLGDTCTTGLQVDATGRLYVCGFVVGVYNNPYILPSGFVLRLTAAGALDTSFGTGGITTVSLGLGVNSAVPFGTQTPGARFAIFTGMRIQSSGNIVCSGTCAWVGSLGGPLYYYLQNGTAYNPRSVLLCRFTPAGVLDTGFGTAGTGIVETNYNNNYSYSALAGCDLYNDNSIVVGGYQSDLNNNYNNMDSMWAKFTANGSIDTSFNNGTAYGTQPVQGVVVWPVPTGQTLITGTPTLDACYSLVTDCNNRIIGAGVAVTPSISIESATITGSEDFSIVRLTPDGNLDTSFNGVGYNLVECSTGIDAAYSVDVDHVGNIDAVGYSVEPLTNFRKLSLCQLGPGGNIRMVVSTNSVLSSGDNYAAGCAAVDSDKLLMGITVRNNTTNNLNIGAAKFVF